MQSIDQFSYNDKHHAKVNRNRYIGSSDIPVIMGVSPYKTPLQLYHEKLSTVTFSDGETNKAMRIGIETEPQVREWFNIKYGTNCMPKQFVHDLYDYFRASLDGWCDQSRVAIEIKTQNKYDHDRVALGIVRTDYLYQMMWQHMLAKPAKLFYVSHNKADGTTYAMEIRYDNDLVEKLKNAGVDFWNRVQKKEPPEMTSDDVYVETSQQLIALANQYTEISNSISYLKTQKEQIEKQLIDNMKHPKVLYNRVLVNTIHRKGNVDYSIIPELKNVDLERYRKQDTTYHKFTVDPKDTQQDESDKTFQ